MTTQRQIKNLFGPLLEQHSDMALVGPFLILKPVRHVANSVMIDRTSSADVFRPRTASIALLGKLDYFGLGTGDLLYRVKGPGAIWRWSNPSVGEDFLRVVENEALPLLQGIRSLQDFYNYAAEIHGIHFPFFWGWRAIMNVAMNRLDEARDILNDPRWIDRSGVLFNREVEGLGDRLKARGADISRKDKLALVDILNRWEAYSVEKLKLTAIWERTPFPLEEQL
ncbi:MAG: hypothetical protein ACO1NY_02170 [Pseudorhodoplanes sp.]